jgi:predicted amidohydrolase
MRFFCTFNQIRIPMKIALFQTKLAWENPTVNRKFIQDYFLNEDESFDLFILPEMFTSGFTMHPHNVAESMDGPTMTWLKELAMQKKCAITGSLVIKENDNFYNRLVFVFPSGEVAYYNKRHLFALAGEDKAYTKGEDK